MSLIRLFFSYVLVSVEVYACEWLAEYCDECLDLPPRFGCGWCVYAQENIHNNDYENKSILNEGKCRTQNSCVTRKYFNGSAAVRQHSFRPGDVCPDPEILTVSHREQIFNFKCVLSALVCLKYVGYIKNPTK